MTVSMPKASDIEFRGYSSASEARMQGLCKQANEVQVDGLQHFMILLRVMGYARQDVG